LKPRRIRIVAVFPRSNEDGSERQITYHPSGEFLSDPGEFGEISNPHAIMSP